MFSTYIHVKITSNLQICWNFFLKWIKNQINKPLISKRVCFGCYNSGISLFMSDVCSINTDLCDALGNTLLNELLVISMRGNFPPKYYYFLQIFNLMQYQNISRLPHHSIPIHCINYFVVFYSKLSSGYSFLKRYLCLSCHM